MSNDKTHEALIHQLQLGIADPMWPHHFEIHKDTARLLVAALSASEGAAPVAVQPQRLTKEQRRAELEPSIFPPGTQFFTATTPQPAVNGAGLSDDVRRASLIAIEAQRFADDRTHLGAMVYLNDLAWALRILAAPDAQVRPVASGDDLAFLYRVLESGRNMTDEQQLAARSLVLAMRIAAPTAPPAEAQPAPAAEAAGLVFNFDAIERAMRLASMLAGSVGANDVERSNGYNAELRSHLAQFMGATRPAAPLSEGQSDEREMGFRDGVAWITRKPVPESWAPAMAAVDELDDWIMKRCPGGPWRAIQPIGVIRDHIRQLASPTPAPQPTDEATDAGRIDALQRNRWGLIPEFEGDWHVVRYDMGLDDGVPYADEVAFAGGNTVRAAIDCAIELDAARLATPPAAPLSEVTDAQIDAGYAASFSVDISRGEVEEIIRAAMSATPGGGK